MAEVEASEEDGAGAAIGSRSRGRVSRGRGSHDKD